MCSKYCRWPASMLRYLGSRHCSSNCPSVTSPSFASLCSDRSSAVPPGRCTPRSWLCWTPAQCVAPATSATTFPRLNDASVRDAGRFNARPLAFRLAYQLADKALIAPSAQLAVCRSHHPRAGSWRTPKRMTAYAGVGGTPTSQ